MTKKSKCPGSLLICLALALSIALGGCNTGTAPQTPGAGKPILPPQAMDHFRQGQKFLADKKLDEALKEFQETARLAPDSPLAYFWLGKVYFIRKDKEEAEKFFHKVLKLEPNNYHALTMLGEISSLDRTRLDQAQTYLEQALKEAPEDLDAHFSLARVFAMKGDREHALIEFRFIFSKEAEFPLYHFVMGQILEAWGRKDEALQNYQRALTLNPHFKLASQAAKRLEAAPQAPTPAPASPPAKAKK